MDREIDCLSKNKTWELIEWPEIKNVLNAMWVFAKKNKKNI